MNIKYRQFKISDSKIVAGFIQNLYKEDPSDKRMLPRKIKSTFKSLINHPDRGTIIVFEHGEEIVGYAILINFWSNEFGGNIVDIDELFIKKKFRSRGIGTDFIKHLAKNKFGDSVALRLEVTPANNKARKLYTSLGFKLHKNNFYNLDLD